MRFRPLSGWAVLSVSCLILIWIGSPAIAADSQERYSEISEVIKPGSVIRFVGFNHMRDRVIYSITVLKVGDGVFEGFAEEEGMEYKRSVLPGLLPWKLEGTFKDDGCDFTALEYDVEDDSYEPCWHGLGRLNRGLLSILWDPQRKPIETPVSIVEVQRVSTGELDRMSEAFADSIQGAQQRWQEIREDVNRLREKGHDLDVSRVLENGQLGVEWSGNNSKRGVEVQDLQCLPYIHELWDPLLRGELADLKGLQHIGSMDFGFFSGEGLNALADGPQIDGIKISSASEQGIRDLSRLKTLQEVQISFDYREERHASASVLRELASLPELRCLELIKVPGKDPGALRYLTGAGKLEYLWFQEEANEASLAAIPKLVSLKALILHSVEPEYLKLIQHDGLEELKVACSFMMDDSHLIDWKLPPKSSGSLCRTGPLKAMPSTCGDCRQCRRRSTRATRRCVPSIRWQEITVTAPAGWRPCKPSVASSSGGSARRTDLLYTKSGPVRLIVSRIGNPPWGSSFQHCRRRRSWKPPVLCRRARCHRATLWLFMPRRFAIAANGFRRSRRKWMKRRSSNPRRAAAGGLTRSSENREVGSRRDCVGVKCSLWLSPPSSGRRTQPRWPGRS